MHGPDVISRHNLGVLWRHRRVFGRLAKNYARVLAGNRRVLRGVEFCVTYRCQLDCRHCLTKPLIDQTRPEMTTDQAVRAIANLAALGAVFINVTGGEALQREDIFELLERAAANRSVLITLASNGLALDAETAARLRKIGVAMVTMSLDGPDAATHDASRGCPGAYDALLQACAAVRAEGLELWLTTILTAQNTADGSIFRIAELARELGATLTVNFAYAVGNWRDQEAAIGAAEEKTFRELLKMPHVRWEGSSNYLHQSCPAGTEKLYVTPYGEVMPCATIQRSFGNLLTEPIADIWRRMGKVEWFRGHVKPCLVAQDPEFIAREMPTIQSDPGRPWSDD
ncbi:MAG: radical SAM protein [Candidatus Lernaella stagnicola]|nr:radical SAM protein [Candidatus Lernaella stagnicola]